MSNYNTLKTTINANIKQNENQEITGQILNSVLKAMLDALGMGYQFMGIASHDTDPGTPDAKVFYIANAPGTYSKFGGLVVAHNEISILKYSETWSIDRLSACSAVELDSRIGNDYNLTLTDDRTRKICDINIKSGDKFIVRISGTAESDRFLITPNSRLDPILVDNIEKGQDYEITAPQDIESLYLYVGSSFSSGNLDIKLASGVAYNIAKNAAGLSSIDGDVEEIKGRILAINDIINGRISYSIVGGVNDAGQIIQSSAAKRTDFILATPGITINGFDGAGSYFNYNLISFFDENKNFISQYPFDTEGYKSVLLTTENIPQNAKYFIAATLASSAEKDIISYVVPNRNESAITLLNNLIDGILPLAKTYTDTAIEPIMGQINNVSQQIDGIIKRETKTSTSGSIKVWVTDTPEIESYKLRVDCLNPVSAGFNLYKGNNSSDLAVLGYYHFGEEIPITRDANKPNLYIYNTLGSEFVDARTYTISFISYNYVKLDIEVINSKLVQTSRWDGKTLVCFGDSITEFGDQFGKRYSDYIAEITGVNAINVGIGGTQYRQRRTPADVFSPTISYVIDDVVSYNNNGVVTYNKFISNHQGPWSAGDVEEITGNEAGNYAYAALDVVNMVAAAYNGNYQRQIDAAIYLRDNAQDNNVPVIERLQAIDWTKVDLVTFAAGTNDWNNAWGHWGQSGSTNINESLGGFNKCIQMILQKNPNIKVYVLTPIVRWLAETAAERTNENWSDNATKGGYTLREFAKMIFDEAMLNHIPVADMYNTLGINQDNFTAYFGEGGTHPLRYEMMARKIVSFINANRTF